eukprot:Gb_34860 [translate_table: standard]
MYFVAFLDQSMIVRFYRIQVYTSVQRTKRYCMVNLYT